MSSVNFALVIHSHQPVGNFDHVIEEAYQKSYLPFLEALLRHPKIRLCLHTTGILLEWIEKRHAEYFDLIRQLVDRGQVELIGGGYFEPILLSIPDADKIAQIARLADYLEKHFGTKPRGAWVAERVWEPSLARPLARAGVDYVILDDTHFLAAGLEPGDLRGAYITEEVGSPLLLIPSLKSLRYTIPFREPEETLRILSAGRAGTGRTAPLYAMGDDCEKFGVWPGTFEHCYTNHWLEKFLTAVEDAGDWLKTTTLSAYVAEHAPLGRTYLPTASYEEMMGWALPTSAARSFKAVEDEMAHVASGERTQRFLRGGIWRNFLAKYSESNQIHKLMLEVSSRWHAAESRVEPGTPQARWLSEAHTHLLASQCNDAYWHGVFGGLYAPHLRSALLRHLIQAEVLLDKLENRTRDQALRIQVKDFDVDGKEELLADHDAFALVVRPEDGGTISSLRFKPVDVELINSLMRRPEVYHDQIRERATRRDTAHEGPASIHDHVWSKEPNLSRLLRYDQYPRNVFRSYVFPAAKQIEDFDYLRLEESRELAEGAWSLVSPMNQHGSFAFERQADFHLNGSVLLLHAAKTIAMGEAGAGLRLECRSSLSMDRSAMAPLALGVEMVFNLLAPDVPDRYFLENEIRRPLEFRGEVIAPRLMMVDEWQRVRISMQATPQPRWWIVPIETISQSESGFERIYQGSAILAVWKVEPSAWRSITCSLSVEVDRLGSATERD